MPSVVSHQICEEVRHGAGAGTMGAAKIGGKNVMQTGSTDIPQCNAGSLDSQLQVYTIIACADLAREGPPRAREEPVPHFGKPSGLAPGSRMLPPMKYA